MRNFPRLLAILFPLIFTTACGVQIPDGWHVVDANDVQRTQLLRAISCGETPEVGLIIGAETLSAEHNAMIDGLAVARQEVDARIIRPSAETLAVLYTLPGVTVLIGDKTPHSWSALVPDELFNKAEPVAVILDLPISNFAAHVATLAEALPEIIHLRAIASTSQVMARLTYSNLRRLETFATVCVVYPDAALKLMNAGKTTVTN